jgi:hypothetical protein
MCSPRSRWHSNSGNSGIAVRLCISPNFVDWAKRLGLEAVPYGRRDAHAEPKVRGDADAHARGLRRLRESMPDLITTNSRPSAPPPMAAMSSSAPTRISMPRRRSPNTQALAA